MGSIYSFILIALLGCSSEKTISLSYSFGGPLPDKIVLVECVNEPGMEMTVVYSLSEFPIRNIQVRGGGCCLQVEAILALRSKHLAEEVEQRLKTTNGVLKVTIK